MTAPDCTLDRYCIRGEGHDGDCIDGRNVFVKRTEPVEGTELWCWHNGGHDMTDFAPVVGLPGYESKKCRRCGKGMMVASSGRECWTCGAAMADDEYQHAPREGSDESKRWCITCFGRVERTSDPLSIANMIRRAAGMPVVSGAES